MILYVYYLAANEVSNKHVIPYYFNHPYKVYKRPKYVIVFKTNAQIKLFRSLSRKMRTRRPTELSFHMNTLYFSRIEIHFHLYDIFSTVSCLPVDLQYRSLL